MHNEGEVVGIQEVLGVVHDHRIRKNLVEGVEDHGQSRQFQEEEVASRVVGQGSCYYSHCSHSEIHRIVDGPVVGSSTRHS